MVGEGAARWVRHMCAIRSRIELPNHLLKPFFEGEKQIGMEFS